MTNVLTKLNSKMKRENWHIILFLDNSCHPSSLKGMFSNVQIEFLLKNTTSRTQPLDAGIIKTWKMYYKRKLLRHVASEIDGKKTASEIVKSVNLLMAIRWMVSAWDEVPSEVISKCFKHVGMYPDEEMEMDDDPFAGEDLLEIEDLLSRISPDQDYLLSMSRLKHTNLQLTQHCPAGGRKCVMIFSGHQRRLKRVTKSLLKSLKN